MKDTRAKIINCKIINNDTSTRSKLIFVVDYESLSAGNEIQTDRSLRSITRNLEIFIQAFYRSNGIREES